MMTTEAAAARPSPAATWFRRVMWAGIVANLAMALPALVRPVQMIELMGLPGASAPVWLSFSALLLILLSAFYAPAAIDPYRYRASAWLAVASRLAGTVFFFLQGRQYGILGAFDLVFFVPLAVLLIFLVSSSPPAPPTRAG